MNRTLTTVMFNHYRTGASEQLGMLVMIDEQSESFYIQVEFEVASRRELAFFER